MWNVQKVLLLTLLVGTQEKRNAIVVTDLIGGSFFACSTQMMGWYYLVFITLGRGAKALNAPLTTKCGTEHLTSG